MKRMLSLLIAFAFLALGSVAECAESGSGTDKKPKLAKTKKAKTVDLFNGKDFKGWTMFLEDPDIDPKSVWKAKDGAIWCKGDPLGFIRTTKKYSAFKLVLEWRWPEEPTNSGVLVWMTDEKKIWPLSMEAQLKHERAGDVVGMGCDFKENQSKEGEFYRYAPRKKDSSEKKPGEWNTYEIVCKKGSMELKVNGKLQNKGTGMKIHKGYIGLQSEGSPIMFRNIKLTPLR